MKHLAKAILTMGLTHILSPGSLFAQPLPDDVGKQLVEAHCNACHTSDRIASSVGYNQTGWQHLIATMVNLDGNPNREKITAYHEIQLKRQMDQFGGQASGEISLGA